MNIDLSGRTALITGATGGIGTAIATEFYTSGADIVITGRNADKLNALCDTLNATPMPNGAARPRIQSMALDLTAIDAPKTLVERTIGTFDRLDILINNAARIDIRMFLKSDAELVRNIMHTNFTIPYNLMQESLPYMLQNKYGRIINTTSVAGYMGDAATSAYAASKGALASAAKSVAAEYGRRGITVNCVAPGIIETDSTRKMTPEHKKEIRDRIPLRRFGRPNEVAHLMVFLASEYASYITGQQIHINGGLIR